MNAVISYNDVALEHRRQLEKSRQQLHRYVSNPLAYWIYPVREKKLTTIHTRLVNLYLTLRGLWADLEYHQEELEGEDLSALITAMDALVAPARHLLAEAALVIAKKGENAAVTLYDIQALLQDTLAVLQGMLHLLKRLTSHLPAGPLSSAGEGTTHAAPSLKVVKGKDTPS